MTVGADFEVWSGDVATFAVTLRARKLHIFNVHRVIEVAQLDREHRVHNPGVTALTGAVRAVMARRAVRASDLQKLGTRFLTLLMCRMTRETVETFSHDVRSMREALAQAPPTLQLDTRVAGQTITRVRSGGPRRLESSESKLASRFVHLRMRRLEQGQAVLVVVDPSTTLDQREVGAGIGECQTRIATKSLYRAIDLPAKPLRSLTESLGPRAEQAAIGRSMAAHARHLTGSPCLSLAVIEMTPLAANPGTVHDVRHRLYALAANSYVEVSLGRVTAAVTSVAIGSRCFEMSRHDVLDLEMAAGALDLVVRHMRLMELLPLRKTLEARRLVVAAEAALFGNPPGCR